MAQTLDLTDIWTPAGVLLGFQIALFYQRLQREVAVDDKGWVTWITPSDYLGIAGTFSFVLGVFLLPLSGIGGTRLAAASLGLGALLFVGHFLGLCGHYEMFDPTRRRSGVYFPRQEKIIVYLAAAVAIGYAVMQMVIAGR
jgi:hypothetical protein